MAGILRHGTYKAASAFSFESVESQADRIVADARVRAARLLEEAAERARAEFAAQRERLFAQGVADGRAAGIEQIHQEARQAVFGEMRASVAQLAATLQTLIQSIEQRKHRLLAEAETGLIELALEIARRVCKSSALQSTDAAVENVRCALGLVRHAADVEVLLCPEEHALLAEFAPEFAAGVQRLQHVRFGVSPEATRGGCIVRTIDGEIDATFETQLQRLADLLVCDAAGRQERE
ncbi:flagellar assembly protein H [Phycisphaerae bacterium RAS1]|nr:flagellar assembly protein H [Phycisphaerae bacterium RAS1]